MNYTEFAQQSIKSFKSVQNRFSDRFKINDYDNWFYDQHTQLLSFSNKNDDQELNFKYIPIGTFSKKSQTWMWSWNNRTSVEKGKYIISELKNFGERKGYDRLIEGHFAADEFTGWEFIAIAHKILGGVGGYRVKSDHLEIYFLVYEHIDNKIARQIKEQQKKLIQCDRHGQQRMAFVCQHLFHGVAVGFEEVFPSHQGMKLEEDDDFQAWCTVCEKERVKADGWNDELMKFADIKLVCEDCYFDIKAKYQNKN
ncbi:MAG: DUF6882 domain-containing protein [Saprospiraceae bacterium]